MKDKQPNSRSYLLRLWWTSEEGTEILRIHVEDPFSGKRTGFSSLEKLNAFLREEVGIDEEAPPRQG